MLIATPEKRILYMSATYEGTVHDKRIADEEALDFGTMTSGTPSRTPSGTPSGFGTFGKEVPEQVRTLLQDLGFQGYEPEGVCVVQPEKKPRGTSLTSEQKAANRDISRKRVVVEHAIGGVKVWRIVKEQIRSWLHAIRDQVMYLACGLHNFRLACRDRPIQP